MFLSKSNHYILTILDEYIRMNQDNLQPTVWNVQGKSYDDPRLDGDSAYKSPAVFKLDRTTSHFDRNFKSAELVG
jgi:hypothetical protein